MNLNDDVVYRWLWLGPLGQLHPGHSRTLIRYYDCLHDNFLLSVICPLAGNVAGMGSPFDLE
jgi:hypothetical protein